MGTDLCSDERDEAMVVARETMKRVRENVERLIALLPSHGYEFGPLEDTVIFQPPGSDVTEKLDALEQRTGPVPLSLRCWYEEVGLVNLIGSHPGWGQEITDPLVVDSTIEYLIDEHAQWEADRGTEWDRGAFVLDLAPDALHKANISGGPPYAMAVPNTGADGLLLWERHMTTFVNYLRITFAQGGFSGWGTGGEPASPLEQTRPPVEALEIARQLLPI